MLKRGGSVEVDARQHTGLSLLGFANAVQEGSQLRITHSDTLTGLTRMGITNAGKGRVMLA